MNLFVLRKTVFLTQRVRNQNLVVTTEKSIHIVIRLGTLLMFVTRNTGIFLGIDLSMENPLKSTMSSPKRTILVNKIRLNTIMVVILAFNFFEECECL